MIGRALAVCAVAAFFVGWAFAPALVSAFILTLR